MNKQQLIAALADVPSDTEINMPDGLPVTFVLVTDGVVYLSDAPTMEDWTESLARNQELAVTSEPTEGEP